MARQFGSYSPVLPLGTTWEENIVLTDADDNPVDLTGYQARAHLRTSLSATGAPVLELSSTNDPAELVITPAEGRIDIVVNHEVVSSLSPDNAKRKFVWDLELYTLDGATVDYVIPCVTGKVTVLPRATRGDLA